MEDIGKFILYALAVGLYYFIMGRKKPAEKPSSQSPSAKPFMSPAAKTQARPRTPESSPRSDDTPNSLEELLRRFQGEPVPTRDVVKPEPMLEDKVKKGKRILTTADRLDREERNKRQEQKVINYDDDFRQEQKVINYDDNIPTYRNEANEVNYEVQNKANYQGLDKTGRNRFEVFEQKEEVSNPYADFLRNPASIRTAFVLNEILKRKEF